jgi:hypothetical protein
MGFGSLKRLKRQIKCLWAYLIKYMQRRICSCLSIDYLNICPSLQRCNCKLRNASEMFKNGIVNSKTWISLQRCDWKVLEKCFRKISKLTFWKEECLQTYSLNQKSDYKRLLKCDLDMIKIFFSVSGGFCDSRVSVFRIFPTIRYLTSLPQR